MNYQNVIGVYGKWQNILKTQALVLWNFPISTLERGNKKGEIPRHNRTAVACTNPRFLHTWHDGCMRGDSVEKYLLNRITPHLTGTAVPEYCRRNLFLCLLQKFLSMFRIHSFRCRWSGMLRICIYSWCRKSRMILRRSFCSISVVLCMHSRKFLCIQFGQCRLRSVCCIHMSNSQHPSSSAVAHRICRSK